MRFAHAGFGEREERFVAGLQRVGAEGPKTSRSLGFGVLVGLEPLGVDCAIFFELGLKTGLGGPRREPADHRSDDHADGESDCQRDDEGQRVDGH